MIKFLFLLYREKGIREIEIEGSDLRGYLEVGYLFGWKN